MYYLKTKSYDSAKLNEKEKITQREYAILKMGGFEQSPNAKNIPGMSQVMLSLLAAECGLHSHTGLIVQQTLRAMSTQFSK